nr:histidine-rich glycoprotein-like [Leptinotarsa decemlineata]
MRVWILATLLMIYCIDQSKSYLVTDASIEELVTTRPVGNNNNTAVRDEIDKRAFKPSKQLFTNILLLDDENEKLHGYSKMYGPLNVIASVSEQTDQINKPEQGFYEFPEKILDNSEGKQPQNVNMYLESGKASFHEPIDVEDQTVSQTLVSYTDTVPYSPEKQEVNEGLKHQKRKEIHYHQHEHLHEHEHKQDHLHKHRQEHLHDHGHSHQDSSKHDHHHLGHHAHHHIGEHFHTHEGSHRHEHQNFHQHDHQQDHNHDHFHQQKHDHRGRHSHGHNHRGEHSHVHSGNQKHDHKHGHEHHDKHRHSQQNWNEHYHQYKHEDHHLYGHHSKKDSKAKVVHQNIYIKKNH